MAATKFAVVYAMLVGCALAAPTVKKTTADDLAARNYEYTFAEYVQEFNKVYSSAEEQFSRSDIFYQNLQKIKAHNSQTPTPSWTMGINQFADLTSEEFVELTKGRNRAFARANSELTEDEQEIFAEASKDDVAVSDLPKSLDWRTKNVVTPVKNQEMCGSCWAFSATETMESQLAIGTGKLVELSPQQLVDCVPDPNDCGGTGGCQGNTQWLAFAYTETAGQTTEAMYPYKGNTGKCETSKIKSVVKNGNLVKIQKNNYTALMNAVANIGPIAISAAAEPWQLYEGGIFSHECGTDVDHGIQLVGYGESMEKMYWLVRNSWGASWGEEGYIRIERFGEGKEPCAMDTKPKDGTGCNGGPSEVQVCGLCGILSDSSYPTQVHPSNPIVAQE